MNFEELKKYLTPEQIEVYEHEKSICDVFSLNDVYKRPARYHVDCTEVRLVFHCEREMHDYKFEMTFIMPVKFIP